MPHLARLVLAVVAGATFAPGRAGAQTSVVFAGPELIRGLLPSVVNITARTETETTAATAGDQSPVAESVSVQTGSGFIIDPAGIIVTNYHVVSGAAEIVVTFSDGSHADARLVGAARVADIALLSVKPKTKLMAVTWGDSDTAQIGDPVVAIGNPLGVGESVSAGIVSGLNRNIRVSPYDDFIQTDAAINHGNSGGALFDSSGKVIGINSAIISPTTGSVGLGFAIPANDARFVIGRLQKYGRVRPGWLGATVQPVSQHMALALGLSKPEGSIIAEMPKNSPAAAAGMQVGDLILRYGAIAPSDDRALLRAIEETPEGQTVSLTILRDNQHQVVTATIGPWPSNAADEVVPPPMPDHRSERPDLGLALADLTPELRTREGLDPALAGVLITAVAPGSAAAEARLYPGDVIMRVQAAPVAAPADVLRGIAQTRTQQRDFVLALVFSKRPPTTGARWFALRLAAE